MNHPTPIKNSNAASNMVPGVAVETAPPETVQAMAQWLKNGTIPADYFRRQVGDPSKAVRITPKEQAEQRKDSCE